MKKKNEKHKLLIQFLKEYYISINRLEYTNYNNYTFTQCISVMILLGFQDELDSILFE